MTKVCFIKIRSTLSSVLLLCLLTTNFYETDVIYLHFQFEFTIIRTKLEKKNILWMVDIEIKKSC